MAKRTFILSISFGIFSVMKNIYLIVFLSLFLVGCGENKPQVSDKPIEKNPASDQQKQPETVAAHTLDKEKDAENASATKDDETVKDAPPLVQKSDKKTKWSRSGTPVDVSSQTQMVIEAEKKLKAKPADADLKKNLAEAYTKRGVVLTSSQQYAAAIGDFRKALKYDANNEIAKNWVEQITGIYKSMNREAPPEGEEPEPLEFTKEKA
jgi:PBP1b-binding outer membrane lipoprotein LpoB